MKIKTLVVATLAALTLTSASASELTKQEAIKIVQPFYDFLSKKVSADDARKSFDKNWKSYYGHGEKEYKGLDATLKVISKFVLPSIPDVKWEIKDALVSGNRVIIMGEASGTPSGDKFRGVPIVKGKSFKIMSIDIHTIENGKVVKSYHVENWNGAIKQLVAKKKSKH